MPSYFADQEPEMLALWDSRRQPESYDWFKLELANLRAAFRWAADHGYTHCASAIAVYASILGFFRRTIRSLRRMGQGARRSSAAWPDTGSCRSSM